MPRLDERVIARLAVALVERLFPEAKPCQSLQILPPYNDEDQQGVYLCRIYGNDAQVYVVEFNTAGMVVTVARRGITMFENPTPTT